VSTPLEVPVANPHAPRIGWVRRLLGPLHVTGVFWYRLPTLAPKLLPGWLFVPAEWVFAGLFYCFLVNIRRAIVSNLDVVLGRCGFWRRQLRALRTMRDFALCFGDRYERLGGPSRFGVVVEGEDVWKQASASRQGTILVTAHVGAWDMSSQLAPQGLARRVHVVREEEIDPAAQEFVSALIRQHGHPDCVTHFVRDDPRLGLELRRALLDGEIVALQGDRPRAGSRSVEATLFGRPFPLPAGPAVLARLAGVPLVPVFCFRERHYRYRIVFRPPIQVAAVGDRERAIETAVQALGREIEWAIAERPHQWFAFGPVWADDGGAQRPAASGLPGSR
jgi:lauroyl/myristoyl acyltransferase